MLTSLLRPWSRDGYGWSLIFRGIHARWKLHRGYLREIVKPPGGANAVWRRLVKTGRYWDERRWGSMMAPA